MHTHTSHTCTHVHAHVHAPLQSFVLNSRLSNNVHDRRLISTWLLSHCLPIGREVHLMEVRFCLGLGGKKMTKSKSVSTEHILIQSLELHGGKKPSLS